MVLLPHIPELMKNLSRSTYEQHETLRKLYRSFETIAINNCSRHLLRSFDVAASVVVANALCRINQTSRYYCSQWWLAERIWSIKMFDSWGRPPAGAYSTGPFFWLGAYDQCRNIDNLPANASTAYCRIDLGVSLRERQRQIPLTYGICVPSECTSDNINDIMNISSRLDLNFFGISISDSPSIECYPKQSFSIRDFNGQQIVTILLVSILCAFIICGTFIDIYCIRNGHHIKREQDESSDDYERDEMGKQQNNEVDIRPSDKVTDKLSSAFTYKSVDKLKTSISSSTLLKRILCAFSVRSTWQYMNQTSSQQIDSLHGLRVLSAFWVAIGHAHLLSLDYVANVHQMLSAIDRFGFLSQLLMNATLAVDSFLLISGTVTAFSAYSKLNFDRNSSRCFFSFCGALQMFAHRLVRLIPAYLLVFLVVKNLFMLLADGPMWSQQKGVPGTRCNNDDWWKHFLFVTNFISNECMPWMWFLSMNFQFYLITPPLLYFLDNWPRLSTMFIFIVILLSIGYRAVIFVIYKFPVSILNAMFDNQRLTSSAIVDKMFLMLYASPQARIASFLIGILLGWHLAQCRTGICATVQKVFLRILCIALLTISLFGSYLFVRERTPSVASIVFSASFRTLWSIGVALLIWLCEKGQLSAINAVLCCNKWIVLSRLSFGFYLTHEPLLLYLVWSRREPIMPSSPSYFLLFGFIASMFSLFTAFIVAILIEIPLLVIERSIFNSAPTTNDTFKTRSEKCDGNSKFELFHLLPTTSIWNTDPVAIEESSWPTELKGPYSSESANSQSSDDVSLSKVRVEPPRLQTMSIGTQTEADSPKSSVVSYEQRLNDEVLPNDIGSSISTASSCESATNSSKIGFSWVDNLLSDIDKYNEHKPSDNENSISIKVNETLPQPLLTTVADDLDDICEDEQSDTSESGSSSVSSKTVKTVIYLKDKNREVSEIEI